MSLMISDLTENKTLDRKALTTIRGGNTALATPFANVNVAINQDLTQIQNIGVSVLNGSVIGSGFALPSLSLAPSQLGSLGVTLPPLA